MMKNIFSNRLTINGCIPNGMQREMECIFLPSDTFLRNVTIAELDHAGDIDYIAKVGDKALGIQIKPVTAKSNFGGYSATERMKASFADFEDKFGGKVFVVFSLDGEIANKDVVDEIKKEIERLSF